MKDTKLIFALQHLNVYELNRFKKFVISPYFNSNESVSHLFLELENFLKKSKPLPSKQAIYHLMFPKTEYKDGHFRKLTTDLLSLFEDFLAHEKYYGKNLSRTNDLLAALSERKLDRLYNSILRRAERKTESSFSKTSQFYFEQYSLQKNIFNLTSEFDRKSKSKKEISNFNIPQISLNLDLFYIIEKLRYVCTILSWKRIHKQDVQINFVDDIINIVENSALLRNRVVQIYYLIYKTYVDEDNEQHFYKLKELIEKYLQIFPEDESKEIFEAAFTYCIGKLNKGFSKFQIEVLALYKKAIETDILLTNGFLSPSTFRNITTSALRLNEFQWANTFIKSYSNQLDKKYRRSIVKYNLALLDFYKKDYPSVLSNLMEFDYNEINYTLGAKSILLATYYELDEDDVLYSFFDSFRTYLDRKKEIPDTKKTGYRNLIKFTKKLIQINRRDKEAIEELKKSIEETKIVFSKQWLLDKVNDLLT